MVLAGVEAEMSPDLMYFVHTLNLDTQKARKSGESGLAYPQTHPRCLYPVEQYPEYAWTHTGKTACHREGVVARQID